MAGFQVGLVSVLWFTTLALGGTEYLESDLLRLAVTTGASYEYVVVEKSTGQNLLVQNRTQFTTNGVPYAVNRTTSVVLTANSLQLGLGMAGTSRTATVLFTFTHPDVLQVDLWQNDGAARWVLEQFTDQGERYYGLVEYPFASALDNRGLEGDLIGYHGALGTNFANARAPFYFTDRNYGIYTESDALGHYALAIDENTSFSFRMPTIRYHILYGSPRQILQSYNTIAGGSFMPPDWALGSLWWRDDHYQDLSGLPSAQARLLEDARKLQELGIPASGMWIDRPYTTGSWGWGGLDAAYDKITFDQRTIGFPSPAQMIAELNGRGMQLMTWIANRQYAQMRTAALAGGFIFAGYTTTSDPAADLSIPDAFNWFRDRLHTLFDLGTRGYKIDRGEEGEMPDWAQNRTTVLCHQSAAASVGNTPEGPNQAYIFSRSTYDKSRRYSAVWNGDTYSDWDGLQVSVKNALRCANINFPMWGSDTGGYHTSSPREVFARWLGFSAYCPMMEILQGPTRTIWDDYDEELVTIAWAHCRTHHDLIPYVRSYLYNATQTGLAVMRPMHVVFPADPNALEMWDEYMYGEALLVAPVTKGGVTNRDVYLPGTVGPDQRSWLDYNDRFTIYASGQTVTMEASLGVVPVLLRAGEILVRGNILQANQRGSEWMGQPWARPMLTVEAFVGPEDTDSFFDYYTVGTTGPVTKRISLTKTSNRIDVNMDYPLEAGAFQKLRLYLDPTTTSRFAGGSMDVYLNGVLADGALIFNPASRRLESIVMRVAADLDYDGDVDCHDLNVLASCMSSPGAGYPASCQLVPNLQETVTADFDKDGDVDQSDFGRFQNCLGEMGVLAPDDCGL
jgi:alpha-glucosidase (family GH31 glycosyl hydrolase)